MRLTKYQIESIKETFLEVFQTGKIYLFGSRVFDEKKGGDIDLYIVTEEKNNLASKRIKFLVKLKKLIGEQKIDIVFQKDTNRIIEQEAIKDGILL